MKTEGNRFVEGFSWAIPIAFADALGACQFSRGDTLYSSPLAYQAWDDAFYEKAKGIQCLQVSLPEAKPTAPSVELFENNWETEAQVQIYGIGEQTPAVHISTTQGRIYTMLWRNNPRILDRGTPVPPLPQTARQLLKLITDDKHPSASSVESSIRDFVVKNSIDATHYFVLPCDMCNELLRSKYEKLLRGLDGFANIGVLNVRAENLDFPDVDNIAPTVDLKIFTFSLDRSDGTELIWSKLKELLYVAQRKKEAQAEKFRVKAHGFFSSI